MSGAGFGGSSPGPPSGDLRFRWLAAGTGADEAEVLRRALYQAIGALGGVGAMAHLAGREEGTLQLVAAGGMPPEVARRWELLTCTASELAPVQAVVLGRASWSTAWPPPAEGGAAGAGQVPEAGVLSVPLAVDGAALGALSVLSEHEPDTDRKRSLSRIAAVVSGRLPSAHRWMTGRAPWWQEPAVPSTVDKVGVGLWSWDLDTGLLYVDRTTEDILRLAGLDPDRWDRHIESWMARIHPDDRPAVQEAIERSMDDLTPYAVEYRVVDQAGRVSWLELRAAFVVEEGRAVRMEGTAWDVSERRSQEAWLVGLMGNHPDPQYVVSEADVTVWANSSAQAQASREGVKIINRVPWEASPFLREQGLPQLLQRARAAPGAPVTDTVEFTDHAGETAYHQLRAVDIGGYVAVSEADVTEQVRAELASAERAQRLEAFNQALAGAWEVPDVAQAVADHLLPLMGADGLIVHDLTGPTARVAKVVGYSDDFVTGLQEFAWPMRAEATVTGAPQIVEGLEEFGRRWPWLLELARRGGKRAWGMVPLVTAGERRVGACVISWAQPRKVTAEDAALLGTIGLVLAHALERAATYEQTRRRADRLEQELLPGRPPSLVGVDAAATYRTASERVAGHWYDTIPMAGGRALLAVGDVLGVADPLQAAITMGILRHAVQTRAEEDLPVDEILARLTDTALWLSQRGPAVTASCLLVEYDATTGCCAVASAGHAPPILLQPGEPPAALGVPVGQPIGPAQLPAEVVDTTLPDRSVLLLHTAGLLTGAGAAASDGAPDPAPVIEAVRRHATATPAPADGATAWLTGLCDAVTGELLQDRLADAAVLAVCTRRIPREHVAAWDLPRVPESAAAARNAVAQTLADWGLPDVVESAELIVSELVSNTVRYARGIDDAADDQAGEVIRLRLLNLGDSVTVECYDGSEATPRVRHPHLTDEFGRGLQLVAAAAAKRWGARYTEHGKCVWAVPASTAEPPDL